MELRELRSLVTLAKLGSIAQTADKLNLSPAAIHKQLKVLETELGVQLYEKAGHQLRLTQAAEVLLPHIKNLLAQYDATVTVLNEWKGLKSGLVRIGTGPTFSSYVLPSLLEEFRRKFPDIEIYVETGSTKQLIEALNNSLLDAAILVVPEPSELPGLKVETIWNFGIALVSNRSVQQPCRLSELQTMPFILYKQGLLFEQIINSYFEQVGFRPHITMRFDNAEAIKAMVRAGLGVSMLPLWAVDADLANNSLFLVQQQESPLSAKLALVTRNLSHLPQPVAAFIQIAKKWSWNNAQLTS